MLLLTLLLVACGGGAAEEPEEVEFGITEVSCEVDVAYEDGGERTTYRGGLLVEPDTFVQMWSGDNHVELHKNGVLNHTHTTITDETVVSFCSVEVEGVDVPSGFDLLVGSAVLIEFNDGVEVTTPVSVAGSYFLELPLLTAESVQFFRLNEGLQVWEALDEETWEWELTAGVEIENSSEGGIFALFGIERKE